MYGRVEEVLSTPPVSPAAGTEIGRSREGRAIRAFRIGRGGRRVSLLGGCHADEPVGPWFLRRLVGWLRGLPEDDPARAGREWWILPHLNPDGEARNREWHDGSSLSYGLSAFAAGASREEPGDDVEFCFPRSTEDTDARPENRAAFEWWRGAGGPFDLHVSLHGMAFGSGPWFLVDADWRHRFALLEDRCSRRVEKLGYRLHDVDRRGEKGFERLSRGFSTRPDSRAMRSYFLGRGDEETARLFRPSSMETVRALGGDPLTLVSEMPLFLFPEADVDGGEGGEGPREWRDRVRKWRAALAAGRSAPARLAERAREAGIRPMPVRHQMELQWTLVVAGLEQVAEERKRWPG